MGNRGGGPDDVFDELQVGPRFDLYPLTLFAFSPINPVPLFPFSPIPPFLTHVH